MADQISVPCDIAIPQVFHDGPVDKDPMGSRASEIVFSALPAGSAELLSIADRGHWLHVEAVDELVAALALAPAAAGKTAAMCSSRCSVLAQDAMRLNE